jgi:hypothetical protein
VNYDIEGAARSILETAGFSWSDLPGALAIAQGLGLQVVRADWLRGSDSTTSRPSASGIPTAIEVRCGLSPMRAAWCIAHEVAEIDLITVGYRGEDVEAVAETLAAALLMPRPLYQRATRELGDQVRELARAFAVPETSAALRLAEVGAVEAAAVVTPAKVYARAPGEFVLPTTAELRRLARGHAAIPGVRRVSIEDAPHRVALVACA